MTAPLPAGALSVGSEGVGCSPQPAGSAPLTGARSGPLKDIRVVDLTVNVLGPVATQILGDMGAEVIKIEPPGGDPNRQTGPGRNPNMAAMHMNMNRNKLSVTLDLKRPEGLEALMRLVDSADVFVHSMRPAAAERLGIGYEKLSARRPSLVYAYGPGFMPGGPREHDPAFDDVLQGESGIADLMLKSVGVARYYPTVIVDKFCGYILASAIGMALYARERTGKGQQVQVPMFETIVSFNLMEHLWGAAFDPPLAGGTGYVRLLSEFRRPYETQDGFICVLAVNNDQWKRLLPAIGLPELVDDARFNSVEGRIENIDSVYGTVADRMKHGTTAHWRKLLDAADIPNGPVVSFQDLMQDEYLTKTGFLRHYEHPSEGPALTTAIPVQFSETPGAIALPPPRMGEHNDKVLSSLGYSAEDILRLTR